YQYWGCQVTLIYLAKHILPTEEAEVAQLVRKQFEQKGMKVLTDSVVQSIQIENVQVHCVVESANDVQTLVFDRVLAAIGVQSNITGLVL
ncbi:FAD-dependent oxidoreductase, partial [Acinetobacter baumannii]|uniref:FAD-dependent oxidoreductase n=1 Tax=Acinetobacter baumannii TaxID=470 RepID=UPI0014889271